MPSFRGVTGEVAKAFAPAEKAADEAGKKSGESFTQRFSGALKGVATAAKVAGAAAGVALVSGVMSNINAEAATDKLGVQLGATGAESERLGKIAGGLYRDAYGEELGDVTDAVGAVVSSIDGMRGANDKAVTAMTAKTMSLASAFELDVGKAAQIAGQMVRTGFAKDAAGALDLLTVSLQNVPAAVREDLLDAVDEYGPFFQSLGMTGEQSMSLLAAGAAKGMYGIDKTGDSIKELTLRATDMAPPTKAAFEAIGADAHQMANNLLSGGKKGASAFQDMVQGLLSIKDPAKRANTAVDLFGTPLEDLSKAEIPGFLKSLQGVPGGMGQVSGAAQRLDTQLNDNTQTSITTMRRSVQGWIADLAGLPGPIGGSVAAVAAFGPAAVSTLAPLGMMVAAHKTAGAAAAASGAAQKRSMATIVGGWIKTAATSTASAIKIAASWLLTAGQAAATAVASMVAASARFVARWALMGAQALAHAARVAAAWLIALGPIGIVIAAVVGLVAVVIANWGRIKAATAAVWNWIKGATSAAWNWIKGAIGKVLGVIKAVVVGYFRAYFAVIKGVWNAIKTASQAVWNGIKAVVSGVVNAIRAVITTVFNAVKAVVTRVWTGIKTASVTVWNAIKTAVSTVANAIKTVVSTVFNAVKTVVTTVWNGIKSATSTVWNGIKSVITGAINTVKSVIGGISAVIGVIRDAFTSAKDAAVGKLQELINWVTGLPGKIISGLGNLGQALWSAGTDIIQGLIDGIKSMASNIVSALVGILPEPIQKFAGMLGLASPSKLFRRFGRDTIAGFVQGIKESRKGVGREITAVAAELRRGGRTGMARQLGEALRAHFDPRTRHDALIRRLRKAIADADSKADREELSERLTEAIAARDEVREGRRDELIEQVKKAVAEVNELRKARSSLFGTVSRALVKDLTGSRKDAAKAMADIARELRDVGRGGMARQLGRAFSTRLAGRITRRDELTERIKEAVEANKKLRAARRDLTKSIGDTLRGQRDLFGSAFEGLLPEPGSILARMRANLGALTKFRATLNKLVQKGFGADVVRQIAAQGVEGGTQMAEVLAKAAPKQVREINKTYAAIGKQATGAGSLVSGAMFNAGVRASDGLVKGLRSRRDRIANEIERIGETLVRSIRKALKIKSPSEVFAAIGDQIAAGLAAGIDRAGGEATAASERLADAVTSGAEQATVGPLRAATVSAVRGGDGAAAGVPNVRVFIGQRELTDIVRVQVDEAGTRQARALAYGRR